MSTQVKIAIIGSGPAGYTAGIYTGRASLQPILFAGYQSGGQLMWTSDIENFPGFAEGVPGPELMQIMRTQAEKFGTTIKDEYVTAVDFSSRPFKIWTNIPDGTDPKIFETGTPDAIQAVTTSIKQSEPAVVAEAVIITTGASSVMLDVPGEAQFLGRGVSTCAVCDAAFYRDKDTFVVGGGDSAMEDTLALTKFAKTVTVIHRREAFKASKIMQDRVLNHPKVKVLWNSTITEVLGTDQVTGIKVGSTIEGNSEVKEIPADGVFIAIGHRPVTGLFKDQLALDEHGYIQTRLSTTEAGLHMATSALDEKRFVTFPTMTSIEGVFAAGDVVDIRYKQAITAAGQGCSAAIDVERWLEKR